MVIRKRGSQDSITFTVRKVSFGEGVERIFPLNSPSVEKIEVTRKGKVKKVSTLLEVGCGTGDLLLRASSKIEYCKGIDLDAEMIKFAEKKD